MEEVSKEDHKKLMSENKALLDENKTLSSEITMLYEQNENLKNDVETHKGANDFLRSQNARLKEILSCVGIAYETYKKEQL